MATKSFLRLKNGSIRHVSSFRNGDEFLIRQGKMRRFGECEKSLSGIGNGIEKELEIVLIQFAGDIIGKHRHRNIAVSADKFELSKLEHHGYQPDLSG
jgi:hypothetical protein